MTGVVSKLIPSDKLQPVRIGMATKGVAGFAFNLNGALRASFTRSLVFNYNNSNYVLPLDGDYQFRYFVPGVGQGLSGLIVAETRLVVDPDTCFALNGMTAPIGSILFNEGKTFVSAINSKGQWPDPEDMELPYVCAGGAEAGTRIGFKRWAIVLRDEDREVTIFEHQVIEAD